MISHGVTQVKIRTKVFRILNIFVSKSEIWDLNCFFSVIPVTRIVKTENMIGLKRKYRF